MVQHSQPVGYAAEFATLRRLELCRDLRRQGLDWDEVIARALVAIPFVESPATPEQTVPVPPPPSPTDDIKVRSMYDVLGYPNE